MPPVPEVRKSHESGSTSIASFSRALIDHLRKRMNDAKFDATLAMAIDEIYRASTLKA